MCRRESRCQQQRTGSPSIFQITCCLWLKCKLCHLRFKKNVSAKMSELRQQLSYLKTVFPETNAPKLPKGVKETFLFDGKKAANLSIEHIHSIASDGLADLIKLDARFRPFSETLFSARNTQLNRELQSKEVRTLSHNVKHCLIFFITIRLTSSLTILSQHFCYFFRHTSFFNPRTRLLSTSSDVTKFTSTM